MIRDRVENSRHRDKIYVLMGVFVVLSTAFLIASLASLFGYLFFCFIDFSWVTPNWEVLRLCFGMVFIISSIIIVSV